MAITKQLSSMRNLSPPTVSRSRDEVSTASNSGGIESLEPPKQLYVLSEERHSPRTGNTRFTRVDSAIAFPRSLGLSLNADHPPRLGAFAWNTGTRLRDPEVARQTIFEFVSLRDVETLSDTYFTSVHPIFDIISREEFNHQISRSWASQTLDAGFEVVLCGVMALGSLFSTHNTFLHEADVVEQARLTLDRTFAHAKVLLSVDFVVGWILRAIYLRSTNGPHVSWVASSMALHIAESIGLHQEMNEIKTTQRGQIQRRLMSETELETRRKTFWVACSLNHLFSAQYGRTKITLQNIGCRYPTEDSNETAASFVSLLRLLPHLCDATSTIASSTISNLTDGLLRLGEMAIYKLPLLLLRADAIFCIYRKLRYIGVTLSPRQTDVVLSAIRLALDAADTLALRSQPWWSVVGVPFHSVCVLIALNSMESLTLLHHAMETLQNITTVFSSHESREALRTAHYLVKVAEHERRGELECLQRCLNLNTKITNATITPSPSSEEDLELPLFEWPTDIDLGFVDLLNTNHPNEDMDGIWPST